MNCIYELGEVINLLTSYIIVLYAILRYFYSRHMIHLENVFLMDMVTNMCDMKTN